ncbi:MAG: hypothetical protein M8357_14140 [Desulfobulbaceae bacterium]|nr:hypothetical protein [Desulfobulbaceae bacterium]
MKQKLLLSRRFIILSGALLLVFMPIAALASSADSDSRSEQTVTMEEVKEKVAAAGRSIEDYTIEQRDQAVARTRQELNELDRNIEMLEQEIDRQWEQLSAETRQQWQDTLMQLRKKRVEAAEWFGGVKRGSAEAWEEIKKGYGKAYSELDRAWEKAKKDFDNAEENKGENKI